MPPRLPENVAHRRWLALIVALGFALRLIYGLSLDPLAVYADTGGDTRWYLMNGYALATGFDRGELTIPGVPGSMAIALAGLPTAPVYLLLIGGAQAVLPPAWAIIAVRWVQAALGALTAVFAYGLARQISGSGRAGLIAAAALAFGPVFILEAAQILTETVYIFLVSGGLWLYGSALERDDARSRLILAGMALGAATLTRAVLLLFPLGLAAHALLAGGWRRGLRRAALLLSVYAAVVATWTVVNLARWDRFIVGAKGMTTFLYIGAVGWGGPEQTDASIAELTGRDPNLPEGEQGQVYLEGAARVIGSDPLGYLRGRVAQLAGAYLQPHGTAFFPGASLRDQVTGWWAADRSPSGLLRLTQEAGFWPKALLYVFQYAGLALGLAGIWRTRRRWRLALPLIGFIAYTTLMHLALDAIPRYLFPTLLGWWVLAAAALAPGFAPAADDDQARADESSSGREMR